MPSKTVPASTPSKCPKSALKESRCATTRIFCSPPRQTYVNHCEPKNVTRHRILQICSSGILAHLSIEVRCTSSSMVSLWPWMFGCDSRGPSFQSSSDSSSKIETMLPMCYNKKSLKKIELFVNSATKHRLLTTNKETPPRRDNRFLQFRCAKEPSHAIQPVVSTYGARRLRSSAGIHLPEALQQALPNRACRWPDAVDPHSIGGIQGPGSHSADGCSKRKH